MTDPRLSRDKYVDLLGGENGNKEVEPEEDTNAGSVFSTSVLLASSGMGSGMFVLPYAMAQSGAVKTRTNKIG